MPGRRRHADQDPEVRSGVAGAALPRAVPRASREGHRASLHRRLLGRARGGGVTLRGLRSRAIPLRREVRLGHGLAELLGAGLIRRRGTPRRLQPLHEPDRGDVRVVRLASGARLRRRPPAHRPAVLHKLVLARPGAPRPLGVVPTKVVATKRASFTVWAEDAAPTERRLSWLIPVLI